MKNSTLEKDSKSYFAKILAPSLQIQLAPAAGYLFSLVVSYFYFFVADSRYPQERPEVLWLGLGLSLACVLAGWFLSKNIKNKPQEIHLKEGSIIVALAWIFACFVSASVFVYAGFPIPADAENFSLFRRFVDGVFESISGFTTTGASILPSVEAFPRGVLMWRSVTHWLGGMGIAYMTITVIKYFVVSKGNIINAEAETPNLVEFESEKDATTSGIDFLKIYSVLTLVLFVLLILSGVFFRINPYEKWYDNVFDSTIHTFGTLGTGGFSSYNASVGMPANVNGIIQIGGLQNKVSEWIIGFFMFLAGANFSLWYILIFKVKEWKDVFKNVELRVFTALVAFLSFSIASVLTFNNLNGNFFENLRFAFFNVTNVFSTTGYGNTDFTRWPVLAQGLLLICYLVGGMAGSTSGGLKISRFIVLYKVCISEIQNLLTGKESEGFNLDGVKYTFKSATLVIINMVLYYMFFLLGGILIMASSPLVTFVDGSKSGIDFSSAFGASIATLGNIGPTITNSIVDAGPNGNFFAFGEGAKIVMIILMFAGRVGILTFISLFISSKDQEQIEKNIAEIDFDPEKPALRA